MGHDVVKLQEPRVVASEIQREALASDLFVWTHTHSWDTPGIEGVLGEVRKAGVPIVAYHLDLYMPIGRWAGYRNDPYMRAIDHFFTVDRLMADWLNDNTPVRGHYLPAGVFGQECYLAEPTSPYGNDVVFVGSYFYHPEWKYRPQLIDWLRQTYGPRFTHVGGDGDTGIIRGDDLNRLYASSKVVVGDTLCVNFDYPDYWSDRVYETLGRGGFLIHPYIKGMDRTFKHREHLAYYTYNDFTDLRLYIDHFLEFPEMREEIRASGHEHVKASQTYTQRWETILSTVFS